MNEYEMIQHPQIEGLSLFFDTVDYRTPHIHPEWELIWVMEGTLLVTTGAVRQSLAPGQMLLLNPRQPHEFHKKDQSATFLCLQCSDRLLPGLDRLEVDTVPPHTLLSRTDYAELERALFSLLECYLTRPPHFALSCSAQTGAVFYQLLRVLPCRELSAADAAARDRSNARLNRLMKYVDENFQSKILLSDFAAQEGVSMGYLSMFIKRTLNQTFQEYVTTVRFHYACQRILTQEKNLLDICNEAGFSDYRYFSKAFKQRTGGTPEEYRSQNGANKPVPAKIHHSLHSLERFYTREQSLCLLEQYRTLLHDA